MFFKQSNPASIASRFRSLILCVSVVASMVGCSSLDSIANPASDAQPPKMERAATVEKDTADTANAFDALIDGVHFA